MKHECAPLTQLLKVTEIYFHGHLASKRNVNVAKIYRFTWENKDHRQLRFLLAKSLWPSDAKWRHRFG